jgi:hypothetical protein
MVNHLKWNFPTELLFSECVTKSLSLCLKILKPLRQLVISPICKDQILTFPLNNYVLLQPHINTKHQIRRLFVKRLSTSRATWLRKKKLNSQLNRYKSILQEIVQSVKSTIYSNVWKIQSIFHKLYNTQSNK